MDINTNSLKDLLRSVILGQVNGADQALALDMYEQICMGIVGLRATPKTSFIGDKELPEHLYINIMNAYKTGSKIGTIKAVRQALNMSLRDAKDFVENPSNFEQNWKIYL